MELDKTLLLFIATEATQPIIASCDYYSTPLATAARLRRRCHFFAASNMSEQFFMVSCQPICA
jgi:hypothetical protein